MRNETGDIREYLERWGMLFEQLGGTRAMGRILAWLLVCDPPEQTAREIEEAVGASAGSVSTTTKALVNSSMIERFGKPGHRSAYFRVRPGMWGDLLRRRMALGQSLGRLAGEGLRFVGTERSASRRLREIESYCRYVEERLPEFLAEWEQEWKKEQEQS